MGSLNHIPDPVSPPVGIEKQDLISMLPGPLCENPPSISRIYAWVNDSRSSDYWNYDNVPIKWGYVLVMLICLDAKITIA